MAPKSNGVLYNSLAASEPSNNRDLEGKWIRHGTIRSFTSVWRERDEVNGVHGPRNWPRKRKNLPLIIYGTLVWNITSGPPLANLSPRLHPKSTLHFELANFAKITLSILNSRPGWKIRAEILKFANLEFHQKVRKLGENDDFVSIGIPIGILLFFFNSTSLRSRERISFSFFFNWGNWNLCAGIILQRYAQ